MKLRLILLGLVFMVLPTVEAARRMNVVGRITPDTMIHDVEGLVSFLGLGGHYNGMKKMKAMQTVQGKVTDRLQQTYGGMDVVGATVSADFSTLQGYTGLNGEVITGLESDIPKPNACQRPIKTVKMVAGTAEGAREYQMSKFSAKRNIFVKENGKAVIAYEVTFFHTKKNLPTRPSYFIDACTLKVIYKFNNIQSKALDKRQAPEHCGPTTQQTAAPVTQGATTEATPRATPPATTPRQPAVCTSPARGQGGNQKSGRWLYGQSSYCLNTTVVGSICVLENDYAKVVNLFRRTVRNNQRAVGYTCAYGYNDAANGAYSPALDAMFFGTQSARMFVDWYGMKPLNFKPVLYVHYGYFYENAFWDGSSLTFGDGRSTFYPLVNQDVVAHELAHGVTSQNSDLIYDKQSGGINEAFSDITGETTEMFSRGYNDWLVGAEIFKANGEALRYFVNPSDDGQSLNNTSSYNDNVDVHYSSGIFNHAFYQMVQVNRMPIKHAYACFLRANLIYWSRTTTFEQGACGVAKACYDLGFDTSVVTKSFRVVGITFSGCTLTSLVDMVSSSQTLTNLIVSSTRRPLFLLKPPTNSKGVRIDISTPRPGVSISVYDNLETGVNHFMASGSTYTFKANPRSAYLRLSSLSNEDITEVTAQITFT